MLVTGEKVTPDQAAEILIRTDGGLPEPSSNTGHFDREVTKLFGVPFSGFRAPRDPMPEGDEARDMDWFNTHWDARRKLRKKLKMLDLSYLCNDQIVSSWIGGPHGWINWNGEIFSNNHNIGKWPSVECVHQDWKDIAKAFPYLSLTCQLMSGETCEDDKEPLVEFTVTNGTVSVEACKSGHPHLLPTVEPNFMALMSGNPNREVGISVHMLKALLEKMYGKIPQYKNKTYTDWMKKRGYA